MTRVDIIKFKCLVNISSQDFSVFTYKRYMKRTLRAAEQHAAEPQDEQVECEPQVGDFIGTNGFGWWSMGTIISPKVCCWISGLDTLLAWFWWHWKFWFISQWGGDGILLLTLRPPPPHALSLCGKCILNVSMPYTCKCIAHTLCVYEQPCCVVTRSCQSSVKSACWGHMQPSARPASPQETTAFLKSLELTSPS